MRRINVKCLLESKKILLIDKDERREEDYGKLEIPLRLWKPIRKFINKYFKEMKEIPCADIDVDIKIKDPDEVFNRNVKNHNSSGCIFVPKKYVGRDVKVIILKENKTAPIIPTVSSDVISKLKRQVENEK